MRGRFGIPAAGLAVVAALLGAAGCASAPSGAVSVGATYDVNLPYNLTDVLFAREMILHYQQAVTLAEQVPDRSADAYVKDLAQKLVKEVTPQMDMMAASLKAWRFQVPDPDNPPLHQMEGMISKAQLLALEGKSGADFDRLWLTTLAKHDYYGVRLAEKARDEGKDAKTVDLARQIAVSQKAQMDDIVKHLS